MTIRIPIKHGRTSLKSCMFKISRSWKLNSCHRCDTIYSSRRNNGKIGKSLFPECIPTIETANVNNEQFLQEKSSTRVFHLLPPSLQSQHRPPSPNNLHTSLDHPSESISLPSNNHNQSGCLHLIEFSHQWKILHRRHRQLFTLE
jgi:hypothetical protein